MRRRLRYDYDGEDWTEPDPAFSHFPIQLNADRMRLNLGMICLSKSITFYLGQPMSYKGYDFCRSPSCCGEIASSGGLALSRCLVARLADDHKYLPPPTSPCDVQKYSSPSITTIQDSSSSHELIIRPVIICVTARSSSQGRQTDIGRQWASGTDPSGS